MSANPARSSETFSAIRAEFDHIPHRSQDDLRRAGYLRVLNRAWFGFGLIALVTIALYPYWQLSIALAGGASVTFAIVEWLMRRHRLRAASLAFCICTNAMFFSIFLIFAALLGSEEAYRTQVPALMLMGITSMFAAALLGPRAALITAAINSVILIGTRLLLAPQSDPRPGVLLFFWVVAIVAFLYENSLNGVFAELRGVRDGLEATVAQRTAELRKTIEQLQQVMADLSTANRDLDLFSGAVAHDLRNPLLIIEGYSRMLQHDTDKLGAETTDALEKMLLAEARMHKLIDGLLAFARLGHHALRIECIPMTALATRIALEHKSLEKGRRIELSIEPLPDCRADPILIEQVFANLFANAIKFTRTRAVAEIYVRGERNGDELIYSVQDNGVGFSMDAAERLFSPLERLHAQHDFEGTGIGLAAVDRMVKLHRGRIWAQSEPDKGATFFFALPIVEDSKSVRESHSA